MNFGQYHCVFIIDLRFLFFRTMPKRRLQEMDRFFSARLFTLENGVGEFQSLNGRYQEENPAICSLSLNGAERRPESESNRSLFCSR